MNPKLTDVLLQQRIVTQEQIEEAVQRQVLYGGSLGTNLLEIDAIEEPVLLRFLGQIHNIPVASRDDIESIDGHIPRLFPLVFAESYHIVPFCLNGDELGVLTHGEPDTALFGRINERLRLKVSPRATTEARMHFAMNRLYGSQLLPRFNALLSRLDGTMVLHDATQKNDEVLSWGLPKAQSTGAAIKKTSLRELLTRLDSSTTRDALVEILLTAVTRIFEFSALFWVHGDVINGWRGSDPVSTQRVARISLPVALPSVFQTIYATCGHYLGPLPNNSANTQLLSDLGRQPPRVAFVAPLLVGGHLAMILYADNGARAISQKRVAAVLLLAQRASLAFARLIQARKKAAQKLLHKSTTTQPKVEKETAPSEHDEAIELGTSDFEVVAEGTMAPTPLSDELIEVEVELDGISFEDLDQSPAAAKAAFERSLAAQESTGIACADDYVAFSNDEDEEDDNLDGWGDVLLEVSDTLAGAKEASSKRPMTTKPFSTAASVTWQAVIDEALLAAKIEPLRAQVQVEVAGTLVDETEILLDGLLAADSQVRQDAIGKLLALETSVDGKLQELFPGNVDFDPFADDAHILPFQECSGLTEFLLARGATAAPIVLPHLESNQPVQRFFAIYYLLNVSCPDAIGALARRLYDTEPRNRHLAADALRQYAAHPSYEQILEGIRAQLRVPVLESQVSSVQLLGQLRDAGCVPNLIPLVVSQQAILAKAVASTLAVLCAKAFGSDVPQWSEWWKQNFNLPREVWLITGLRETDATMRRVANYELQLLTGLTTNYDASKSQADREQSTRMWESWWNKIETQAQQKSP